MAIKWSESAGKRGFSLPEAIFAIANHYHHVPEFDEPRVGGSRPDLYIGPAGWAGHCSKSCWSRLRRGI